jgi:3-oxoacyl-[acyl-carrier protein] reductase
MVSALVTGASRGIGRVVAETLAADGWPVALVAVSPVALAEAARRLRIGGANAAAFAADVTDPAAVAGVVAQVEASLGPIGLVVANAGRAAAWGPPGVVDPDDWVRDVEVNLTGVVVTVQAVLGGMRARRGGRIVAVTSGMANEANPVASAYACAKAAVVRYIEEVAEQESASAITAFSLAPGLVRTDMSMAAAIRRWAPQLAELPDGQWQTAEQSAALIRRIAVGDADALSGRFLHVKDDLDTLLRQAATGMPDTWLRLRGAAE